MDLTNILMRSLPLFNVFVGFFFQDYTSFQIINECFLIGNCSLSVSIQRCSIYKFEVWSTCILLIFNLQVILHWHWGRNMNLIEYHVYVQSSKWKFEFTGPNQSLELIIWTFLYTCTYLNKKLKNLLVWTKFHWSWDRGPF